jgi:molybdopterin converting factor small subunit
MNVAVKLFARARDIAGTDCVSVELPDSPCVGDLRSALCECIPELRPLAASLLISVGTDYAKDDTPILPGDIIACFPPVSGG